MRVGVWVRVLSERREGSWSVGEGAECASYCK